MARKKGISPKQKRAIERLTAYTSFAWPSEEAILAFFKVTDRGENPQNVVLELSTKSKIEFADLMFAHAVSSRKPHPLLEGLWRDGIQDYSITALLIDKLNVTDKNEWMRRLPSFQRAYELSTQMKKERKENVSPVL